MLSSSLKRALLIFFILAPSCLFAGVKEYALPNGLKVLMLEDHKSPIAVFQIWYRVGSRDEAAGKSGLSHLLEHMMFKGTPRYGSKVLSRTIQRYGGTDNAFTSKDCTVYFQILPANRIGLSIDFESDRMRNLVLTREETLSERSVVMEERRLRYDDDPRSSLYELTVASAFSVHPYRRPVIGWMRDIAGIGREELLEFYRSYYCPANAFIVVVGDINPEALIEEIRAAFGEIKPGPERKGLVLAEPPQKSLRRVYLKREAELPYILVTHHVPGYPEDDAYALDMLYAVLSGGRSGRLFKALVYEKKVAVSAFADYSGFYEDPYLFTIGGTASPGLEISALEKAIYKELKRIKSRPPSEFELQKAGNQVEAAFIMGQDSIFHRAMLIGRFEMLGDWRLKETYLENIRKVTARDISRVARKYLTEENRTVGILIPERAAEGERRKDK